MQALRFTGTDRYTVAAASSHEAVLHNTYLVWTVSGDPSDGSKYFLRKTQGASTLRRQFLHSGANISGAIASGSTWNLGASRDAFAAHTPARGVPNFIAAVMTGTGVATDQKVYLGTHRIPAAEPSAYLFRAGGNGTVTGDASATTVLGNRHLFDEPAGPWALWAWFNRVLRLEEIWDFQFDPFAWEGHPDCIMYHVWDVPSAVVRDRSGKGNDASAVLASIAAARALVPLPTRFAVRSRVPLADLSGGTPVESSLACAWESLAAVELAQAASYEALQAIEAAAAPAWESAAALEQSAAPAWESAAAIEAAESAAWESAAGVEAAQIAAWEALAGVERELVVPWEAAGTGTPVEASLSCTWESLGAVERSASPAWESLYRWPWGEVTTLKVAIFVLASDQSPGQTVLARNGPNGWLGDSPGDAINDPILDLSAPERWRTDRVANRNISFGDVLLPTFNGPFSIIGAVELLETGDPIYEAQIAHKFRDNLNGVEFYLSTGDVGGGLLATAVIANVKFGGGSGWTDYDSASATLAFGRELAGRRVLGMHYDWTAPRGARMAFFLDGAPATTDFGESATGSESPVATTDPLQFLGSVPGGFSFPPESGRALIIVEGVLSPATHANAAQWLRDEGWTLPVEQTLDAAWESGAVVERALDVAWEAEGQAVAIAPRMVRAAYTEFVPKVRGMSELLPKVRGRTALTPKVRGETDLPSA